MPERHKRAFEEYLRGRDTKKLFKGVRIDTPYGERKIIKCLPDRELLRITKDLAAEKALYTMDADQSGHIRDREKKLIKQFEGVLAETFAHIALMCLLPQAAVDRFDLDAKISDTTSRNTTYGCGAAGRYISSKSEIPTAIKLRSGKGTAVWTCSALT